MKIYLAHPISGLSYEEVVDYYQWTKHDLERFGFTVLNPMTGKRYLRNELEFKSHGYDNPVSTNHAIWRRDTWMVSQADIIYLNLMTTTDRVTIGGIMELAIGAYLGKHTIAAIPEGNIHEHAFVLEACDIIFRKHEEALEYLRRLSGGTV